VPTISSLAVDSTGNVYAADTTAQGLIRITPAGGVAEYPTYSGQDAPPAGASIYVTIDSTNDAYVADVVQTLSGSMVGGLSIVGASSW
jgi:DNA-binding beta-propeller fold protein YncE